MLQPRRQRPRTCVGCKEESPKRALIRVVRSPEGAVLVDERGKLPGRGAYLCACLECLGKARKSRALARALKTEVGPEVYEALEGYICSYAEKYGAADVEKELRSLLGLGRRAGLLFIGIDSIKLQSAKEPLFILRAEDSSDAVRDNVARIVDKTDGPRHESRVLPFGVERLASALGAANVQVIALPGRNGLADKIKMLLKEGGVALEQNESLRACQSAGEE